MSSSLKKLSVAFGFAALLPGCASTLVQTDSTRIQDCTIIKTHTDTEIKGKGEKREEQLLLSKDDIFIIPGCHKNATKQAIVDATNKERLEVIIGNKEAMITAIEGLPTKEKVVALRNIMNSLNNVTNPEDAKTTTEAMIRTGTHHPEQHSATCKEVDEIKGVLICDVTELAHP